MKIFIATGFRGLIWELKKANLVKYPLFFSLMFILLQKNFLFDPYYTNIYF